MQAQKQGLAGIELQPLTGLLFALVLTACVIEHGLHRKRTGYRAEFGEAALEQGGVVAAIQVDVDRLGRQRAWGAVNQDLAEVACHGRGLGEGFTIGLDVDGGAGVGGLFAGLGVCSHSRRDPHGGHSHLQGDLPWSLDLKHLFFHHLNPHPFV